MATVTIRELVRQKIAATVTQLGGGVLEPENFDAAVLQGQPLGFQFAALIKMGIEPPPTPEGAREVAIEVWTFGPQDGTFTDIDAVNAQIIDSINWRTFQEPVFVPVGAQRYDEAGIVGNLWLCTFDGTPYPDTRDQDLQSLVRPIRFKLQALRWRQDNTDNVLQALQGWAASTFYQAQTNPATWNPTDLSPLIYFRYAGVAQTWEELTFDARWMIFPVQCHVVSPTPDIRDLWLNQIAAAMAQTSPLGIQAPAGDFIHVSVPRTDTRADPVTEGQISMRVKAMVIDSTATLIETPLKLVTLTSGDNPQKLGPTSDPPRWTATQPATPQGGQEATGPTS